MKKKNKNVKFQTNYTLDLNTYKEFSKGYFYSKKSIVCILSLLTIIIILLLLLKSYRYAIGYSVFVIFYMLMCILLSKNKINYKRTLENNKGNPPTINIELTEEEIRGTNLETKNKIGYLYTQIIGIIETKNLIILKMNYNQGLILNKNTLSGGTETELIEYVYSKCPNIKNGKVIKSKINNIIMNIILVTVSILLILGIYLKCVQKDYFSKFVYSLEKNEYEVIDKSNSYKSKSFKNSYILLKDNSEFYAYLFELRNEKIADYYLDYWNYGEYIKTEKFQIEKDEKNNYEKRVYSQDGENLIVIKKYNYIFCLYNALDSDEEVKLLTEKINTLEQN